MKKRSLKKLAFHPETLQPLTRVPNGAADTATTREATAPDTRDYTGNCRSLVVTWCQ